MKNAMKYLAVFSFVLLGVALMTGDALAQYGYSGYPYGQQCGADGCGGRVQQPMRAIRVPCQPHQRPQYPVGYCVQWVPEQLNPVQVMIPGRWEYRPVWISGREVTLYQRVPGYWKQTNLYGVPNMSSGQPSSGCNAQPYQQTGSGYFNAQGVWCPSQR